MYAIINMILNMANQYAMQEYAFYPVFGQTLAIYPIKGEFLSFGN